MKHVWITALLLIAATAAAGQVPAENRDPAKAEIVTSDIDLFWKAYDKAKPENDLIVYRDEYLRKGSVGLKEFERSRIGSVCELVYTIAKHPSYYRRLREHTSLIPGYEPKIRAALYKLQELYPDAVFPPVYFVIGRMSSGGTLTDKGLLIGSEMYGMDSETDLSELDAWHRAVLGGVERVPFIVAHELIHYQQARPSDRTLLSAAIREGGADFVGELISGGQINPHLHEYGNPREAELWQRFETEMEGTDYSNWLYEGDRAKDRPADLGYYMGYKIVESYYMKAADKKLAVREILESTDSRKFLEASGYKQKFAGGGR